MTVATVDRIPLSGSTNGRRILLTGTNSAGAVTLHTATNTSGVLDWITIDIYSSATTDIEVSIEFGNTTAPDDVIRQTIRHREGITVVIDQAPLRGGLVVKAFAATGSVITAGGYVSRVTSQ